MAKLIKTAEIEGFLRRIWAFEQLEWGDLRNLVRLVVVRELAPAEILWLQGQSVTYFTIVYYGLLRSVRRSSSGEKLVSMLSRGWHFGLAEMITGETSAVTVIAAKPSTILTIDRNSLRKLLLSNTQICYRFMQTMARAIFKLTVELERASFENVPTRLARLLLNRQFRWSSPKGTAGATGKIAEISHDELAVQLGVSRETVSRTLADFRRQGLIKTAYRNISVLDHEGLMEYIEDYDSW